MRCEIADHLVEAPKSRIVEQMTNGVFVRMAIIEAILKVAKNDKYLKNQASSLVLVFIKKLTFANSHQIVIKKL